MPRQGHRGALCCLSHERQAERVVHCGSHGSRTTEQLRIAISVTLALVPRHKRDFTECIRKSDPAKAEIVARVVAERDRRFEIAPKPIGPGPHSAGNAGRHADSARLSKQAEAKPVPP
jgi:hypothetical protein